MVAVGVQVHTPLWPYTAVECALTVARRTWVEEQVRTLRRDMPSPVPILQNTKNEAQSVANVE